MLYKSIFAGFGGQGVLLMGVCLATAAMNEDKFVTYMPSYGAEVRGGTANCTVAISTEEIASPIASSPDFVVVLNSPSLTKFQNLIKPGGVFITNSDLVEIELQRTDVTEIRVPGTEIAEKIGSPRSVNMAMLGAYAAACDMVSFPGLLVAVREVTGKKKLELAESNISAVQAGYDFVRDYQKQHPIKKKTPVHKEPVKS